MADKAAADTPAAAAKPTDESKPATPAAKPETAASQKAAPATPAGAAGPERNFDLGFPVHAVAQVGDNLIAAGGGGEAKTGIANAMVWIGL